MQISTILLIYVINKNSKMFLYFYLLHICSGRGYADVVLFDVHGLEVVASMWIVSSHFFLLPQVILFFFLFSFFKGLALPV